MKYKILLLLAIAFFATTCSCYSQCFQVDDVSYINGYEKTISGEVLPYFSLYRQYAKDALLTRCTDGKKVIEWETDTIPSNTKGAYVYFTWIAAHSTGTSGGNRNFDLFINDKQVLTFTTHPKQYPAYWSFTGKDSTCFTFAFKTKDGANDAHGMAYLRVPLRKYKPGQALRIKVVGQNQQSNDWYMTFRYSFREKIELATLPFLLKNGNQSLQVTVLHFGKPDRLNISIKGAPHKSFVVKNGFNTFELELPAVVRAQTLQVAASVGKILSMSESLILKPVAFREVNLIHHSHTDIGYSHIQEEVIRIHNKNIRDALALAEKTQTYPKGSRFVWHIESAWVVDNFLKEATEDEKKKFFDVVRKGQILISAFYSNNLTGLAMPEEIDWISDFSIDLKRKYQLPIQTAMMTDVPGMSWSVVSSLAKRGIRYFSNGINYIEGMPGNGDRIGHVLDSLGDKPFWWKSPSGKDSILMWCGAKGYSSWHGTAAGAVFERGSEKIASYLNELDAKKYPYSMVHWRYNIVADNGPVDPSIADFVLQWNNKYSSPKLVLANATDMFRRFEKLYGKTIPVLSGDFTPYWEDGAYSTAKEEGANRMAAQKIISLEKLARQKHLALNPDLLRQAKKFVVLFHEHTWGAHNSITEPDLPFVTHQWVYKKGFGDSASIYTERLEADLFDKLKNTADITVINTLPFVRTGFVEMKCPSSFGGNILKDEKGVETIVQLLANGNIGFIAKNVPAAGEKKYQFVSKTKEPKKIDGFSMRMQLNKSGAIQSLLQQGKEWVDTSLFKGMMQLLYVDGLNPALYQSASIFESGWMDDGPVVKTLQYTANLPGTHGVQGSISQFADLDFLKVTIAIDKKEVRGKESVHIALPFKISNPEVRMDAGLGVYGPDYQQLPGSNKEYYSVPRWLNVSGSEGHVTVACPQGALFEVGAMMDEQKDVKGYKRWKQTQTSSSLIFLYAMNNYWHTNFKAGQEGKATFDVYLKFRHQPFKADEANKFGYECTEPFWVLGAK